MTSTHDDFLARWRSSISTGQTGLTLMAGHPLEMFAGLDDLGKPKLAFLSTEKPTLPTMSKLVTVERSHTKSDKWYLTLTLQDDRFVEVFLRLADDLCHRALAEPTETAALLRLNSVLDEWQRLLRPRGAGRLTMDELRGFVGELWLLLHRFDPNYDQIEEALAGWIGPFGLPQDFVYGGNQYYEAKAIGPATTRVKISSAEQLDVLNGVLELIVVSLPNVTEGTQGAVSLAMLVAEARTRLDKVACPHDDLDLRLAQKGIDMGDGYYTDTWFLPSTAVTYSVSPDFPAVRASTLPMGVDRVTYQLTLTDLTAHEIANEVLN